MPGFEHGLNRVISSFLSGIFTGLLLKIIFGTNLFDKHLESLLTILLGIASILDLITKMKYWSTTYILGFITGYFIITYTFGTDIFVLIIVLYAIYILVKRQANEL